MKVEGFPLMVAALIFQTTATRYFGYNIYPQTWQEWMCDAFSLACCMYGLYLVKKSHKPNPTP